jgi:hypothetical protein
MSDTLKELITNRIIDISNRESFHPYDLDGLIICDVPGMKIWCEIYEYTSHIQTILHYNNKAVNIETLDVVENEILSIVLFDDIKFGIEEQMLLNV